MHHLIIAAHPSTKSFNHAVVETYKSALIERKHRVECRDLYAENFNPVIISARSGGHWPRQGGEGHPR